MEAIVASVSARIPADRGWPSMAASSPKYPPASMSVKITARSGEGVIKTRTVPLLRKYTSVPRSSSSYNHSLARACRHRQRRSSDLTSPALSDLKRQFSLKSHARSTQDASSHRKSFQMLSSRCAGVTDCIAFACRASHGLLYCRYRIGDLRLMIELQPRCAIHRNLL